MEETFFEMLERTRAVDRVLFWFAVLTPPLIAGLAALWRQRPAVTRHRHRWVLACITMPGLLILWKVYNAVVDHFGLDSILGLFVNVAVFAAAALLATGLRLALRAAFLQVPTAPAATAPGPIQPMSEFRPYKPSLSDPGSESGYSARIAAGPPGETSSASTTHAQEPDSSQPAPPAEP